MNHINNSTTNQKGVTLLLAVLVLSAITAISFSLATIVFIEIRASGDVTRTEPALYGTQAEIEEVIYKVKRTIPDDSQSATWPSGKNYSSFNSNFGDCTAPQTGSVIVNAVSLKSQLCSLNLDPAFRDTVLTTSDSFINSKNIYTLVNPLAPYSDNDNNGSLDGLYGKILFKYASGPDMRLYICKISTYDCVNVDGTLNTSADYGLTGTGGALFNGLGGNATNGGVNGGGCVGPLPASTMCYALESGSSYQIFVHLSSPPAPTANGYYEVHTCGALGGTPTDSDCSPLQYRGLAFPGRQTVDITATSAGLLTRKYRVFIPE